MPTTSSSLSGSAQLPTAGQLERQLSQSLQAHYRSWTGHSPGHTLCHLSDKVINILIQDSITPLEGLLQGSSSQSLRERINAEIRKLLPNIVLEACRVSASAVMIDSDLNTGQTGIIIILDEAPKVRHRRVKS